MVYLGYADSVNLKIGAKTANVSSVGIRKPLPFGKEQDGDYHSIMSTDMNG